MPVLGEYRMIQHSAIQTEPEEPPVAQIEVDLIAQSPLRSDPQAVTRSRASGSQLGIDRRSANAAVEWRQVLPDLLKVDKPIDRPEKVIRGICLSSENS
jgi:hypothetical protein